MSVMRLVIVLLVATAAAIGLALTFRTMSASHPAVAQAAVVAAPPQVRVLVAHRDLKVGERLQPEDVVWQPWPAGAVNPAFITGGQIDPKSLATKATAALQTVTNTDPAVQPLMGSLVLGPILANEPMSKGKLVQGGQGGFMAIKLPAGMRAMALPVNVESGAGGFILPGDHVDVILNMKINGGAQPEVLSRIVMRNLTVLAIDQATEAKQGASSIVGVSATLQVPADDVNVLAKARDQGPLLLALRSYHDIDGPQGAGGDTPARHAVAPIRIRDESSSVHIYRGAKLSEEKLP